MSDVVVTFDFPAISQLFLRRKSIRDARYVQLILNTDALVPSLLVRIFIMLGRRITGRDIKVIRLGILDFNRLGPESIDTIFSNQSIVTEAFVNAVANAGGGDRQSTVRFVRRLLLEKVFVQRYILNNLLSDDATNIVVTDFVVSKDLQTQTDLFVESGLFVKALLFATAIVAPFLLLIDRLRSYPPQLRERSGRYTSLGIQNVRFEHEGAPGELWRFKRSNASKDYIFDHEECVLFITDQWQPPANILAGYKSYLKSAGLQYKDHSKFRTPLKTLFWMFKHAYFFAISSNVWSQNWFYLLVGMRLCGCMFREKIHLDNLRTKTILCFDDYSERHIVRTWLANADGCRTIGMAHSANNGLWATPQLAFVHFDRYLIWNSFSRDLYGEYWPAEMLESYGYDRIDNIVSSPPKRLLPPTTKKRILITLPGVQNYADGCQLLPGLRELVAAINQLDDDVIDKVEILIRPKQPVGWDVLEPEIKGKRVTPIIDDAHSTAEYMRSADLIIGKDGSGILSECAVLRLPVVCFDYFQCPKTIYDRFGTHMNNIAAADLVDVITHVANGVPLDVDFEKVWTEFSYPYVADRTEQLRLIIDSISERSGPDATVQI